MIDPRLEEQAALAALGWSNDPAGLDRAAQLNSEVAGEMAAYADAAAALVFDAPLRAPPPALRDRLIAALGPEPDAEPAPRREAKPLSQWFRLPSLPRLAVMPYAVAACLMGLALLQGGLILLLDQRLDSLHVPPVHHDPLADVQLVDLAPQGDHGDAKVMVAWNPKMCCGMLTMDKMPDAPPGHDYQLWVLDPSKPAPVNAGVVPRGVASQHFDAGDVHMTGRPGFAISLEQAGGAPGPTTGGILFAVAPSP
jgi:anti-sigma-K factor RskA